MALNVSQAEISILNNIDTDTDTNTDQKNEPQNQI